MAENGRQQTSKQQRLVNLVICLMSTNTHLTAERIGRTVQGYEDCTTAAAFNRRFERDKQELRRAGVPIDQAPSSDPGSPPGYRISPADYRLPDLHVTAEQAGVLGIAAQLWRSGEREAAAGGALTKLTAAGITPRADTRLSARVDDPHELGVAAVLSEAIGSGMAVTFEHTPASTAVAATRRVEPWWTGSRSGHWYLVGFDLDRDEPRTFRLVRIAEVQVTDRRSTRPVPAPSRVAELLDRAVTRLDPRITAHVWVESGHGAELRARASAERPDAADAGGAAGDELEVAGTLSELGALVAGLGVRARVVDPPELAGHVADVLRAAARWSA